MVLDPMSALSIAASAVQFVDFSRTIVSKSTDLYRSADGVLDDNKKTETVTRRLKELAQSIEILATPLPSNSGSVDSRLQTICTECGLIANELLQRLHQLKVPDHSQHRKWKSFRHALKSVWSKSEIEIMAKKLSELRAELGTEILFLLRENFTSMSFKTEKQLELLDTKTQTLIDGLLDSSSSRQDFFTRFNQLDSTQKSIFEKLGFENLQRDKQFHHLDANTQRIIELLVERKLSHDTEVAESRRLLRETREAAAKLVERDNLKRVDRARQVKRSILDSLRFPDMDHRPESISSAHETTFNWIFENSKKHQKSWDDFSKWLVSGSGMYWIQGKPASGKSTLMRFIWSHSNTPKLLERWTKSAKLLLGAFYFWRSGSQAQKSYIGLLRTLLFEVLSKNEDLTLQIFREEWEWKRDADLNDLDFGREKWSLSRLQRAFKAVVELANRSLKICFFIDGLDEYDGEPGDIAEYIYGLAEASPYVKFCVSARPLSVFQSVFLSVPGLKLQDLTQDDIKNYVNQKLGSDRHMRSLLQKNSEYGNWLIAEIVQKASGVFLWVILVVKSLIHGFRSGDGIQHLQRRLNSLPVDLESLFAHIMGSIEPEYQEESSKIFQIFRTSNHVLDLFTLHCALLYPTHNYYDAIKMPLEPANDLEYKSVEAEATVTESMRLRLSSRCRGLLEISAEVDDSPGREEYVAGFHRTVQNSEVAQPFFKIEKAALRQVGQNVPSAATVLGSDSRFASMTTLPWNARRLIENTNTPACTAFVDAQMTAKYYLINGHLPDNTTLIVNAQRYVEDRLYFISAWLSNMYGGSILEWIHMTLVMRQSLTGAPQLGLLHEWNGIWPQKADSNAENTTSLPVKDRFSSESQVPDSTGPSTKRVRFASEKQSISSRSPVVYWLSYLHRTAKDFLEEPGNWNQITAPSLRSNFDPQVALLMASLIKIKARPTERIYETGISFLRMIKEFQVTPSQPAIQLIEEYDRILNLRCKNPHWSKADPEWKGQRPDWGDDLNSIAIQFGLIWIVMAREAQNTSPVHQDQRETLSPPVLDMPKHPGLPLIAWAISFHTWAILKHEHPSPDVEVLNQLLGHGYSPNEYFQGHTIWEYILYQIHTHKDLLYHDSKLECWLKVFKTMLLHGANPHACCLQDPVDFNKAVGMADKPSPDYEKRVRGHLEFSTRMHQKYHSHKNPHSVTAIVTDVFSRWDCPGTEELKDILKAQQKSKPRNREREEFL